MPAAYAQQGEDLREAAQNPIADLISLPFQNNTNFDIGTSDSADASVGVGLGENILTGGSDSAFMLQPGSYEGQVGLNVAAGVTTVTLTWAP